MQKSPNAYIQHIIDSVTRIQEYLKDQNINSQIALADNQLVHQGSS